MSKSDWAVVIILLLGLAFIAYDLKDEAEKEKRHQQLMIFSACLHIVPGDEYEKLKFCKETALGEGQ